MYDYFFAHFSRQLICIWKRAVSMRIRLTVENSWRQPEYYTYWTTDQRIDDYIKEKRIKKGANQRARICTPTPGLRSPLCPTIKFESLLYEEICGFSLSLLFSSSAPFFHIFPSLVFYVYNVIPILLSALYKLQSFPVIN